MENKPVVYIFYGDDELAIQNAMHTLFSQLGDPGTADMNTTRLDGAQVSEGDVLNAAATMPFLTERRLVFLSNGLSHLKNKTAQQRFCEMLDRLPQTAALVLDVNDQQRYKQGGWQWELLSDKHWLMRWAQEAGPRAYTKAFPLPQAGEMPRWIMNKAQELEGKFSLDAAQELAGLVENNTRLAAREIEKLLTYVDRLRPVDAVDVQNLTAFSGQVSVFDMVDALGQGNKPKATELLHGLLEQQDAFSIFPMVVRQFRLLLQAREILDEGKGVEHIQRELHLATFVAKKLNYQASRFHLEELKAHYRELLEIDIAAKTGEMHPALSLDVFIASLN